MISVTSIKIGEKSGLGVKIDLPESPPLVMAIADKGFVMCGFLNLEAAEKLNVSAAVISGVKTVDEILNAGVKSATTKAKKLGVETEMKGSEALKRMS